MGTIHHNAVIVTGWKSEHVEEAHEKALAIYAAATESDPLDNDYASLVGPIVSGLTNGYSSFAIHPDGSKEGWSPSDASDAAREEFVSWLRSADLYLDYLVVGFGELGVQAENQDERLAGDQSPTRSPDTNAASTLPAVLREYAAALDKDRGHGSSFVTAYMRDAADEIEDLRREISRREGYIWTLENRIEAAKLALGGHAAVDVLFDAEPTT